MMELYLLEMILLVEMSHNLYSKNRFNIQTVYRMAVRSIYYNHIQIE